MNIWTGHDRVTDLVLVRYGFDRILYVDNVEVARDTQEGGLGSPVGVLYIGAGNNREPGSFFSGLIDDIRIYDVGLSAEEMEAMAQ